MEGKHDKNIMSPQYNSSSGSLQITEAWHGGGYAIFAYSFSCPCWAMQEAISEEIAGGDLMLISEGTGGGGGWQAHE